jgi:hypothetical protein
MRKSGCAAWVAALALPFSAAAEDLLSVDYEDHRDWWISLSGGAGLVDLEGDGRFDEDLGDTKVSFDGELDLQDTTSFWLELDLQPFRGHHLRLAVTPMRFDGSDFLSETITVGGITYDVGDFVESDLKADQYELSYRYAFELGRRVTLAPLLQATLIDGRFEIENLTLGVSERQSELIPIPALGLRAELYPLARLGLFAEGKGLTIGPTATYWDAIGGVSLHLTRNLAVVGRYRWTGVDVDYRDVKAEARFHGPYLAANLRF